MKSKLFHLLIVACVATLMVVGNSDAKTKVTFMTWESPEMNQKIVEALEKFHTANPDIEVELVPSPLRDYGVKIKQMLVAGEAPDLYMTGNDWALQYMAQGLLYDWKPMIDKNPELLQNFYPGVIENWQINGKMGGLPALLNCYGVFYNKKMFKDAGLPMPAIGWTLDDLITAVRTFANKESKVYGLYYPPYAGFDPFFVSPYAVSAGGQPFANGIVDVTKVSADETFKSIVQKISQEMQAETIQPPTSTGEGIENMFMQSQIAMLQHGQWFADALIRTAPEDLEWGFAPNPTVNTQSMIYDCVGWSSPATIKDPEAVFKVLTFLDTEMYKVVIPQTPVAPPAYQPAADAYFDKLKSSGHGEMAEALDYMLKSSDKQPVRFQQVWAGKANKFIDATWNNVIMGKAQLSDLDPMVEDINHVIQSSK